VERADLEEDRPLPKKCPIGPEEGPGGVVDVRRFGSDAVEFNDCKVFARSEPCDVGVADIKTAEVKAVEIPGNAIDGAFELRRFEVRAVAKAGSLAVIAGHGQPEGFPVLENVMRVLGVA